MLNFLDLLVVVAMVLVAVSLLALCLMFLVRNPGIKKVCFYITAVLGIYAGSIGIRIGTSLFPVQTAVGVIAAAVSIAAEDGRPIARISQPDAYRLLRRYAETVLTAARFADFDAALRADYAASEVRGARTPW